ncbi:MAG: YgiQ family radical SAM protein [Christensenellaceae bacterium]
MPFLPITKQEMLDRGWQAPDFIVVTGDAYVDHPSFGTAIVSRVLESYGYKVCIISQPQNDGDYLEFGYPTCGFFINSGNLDSMVNAYTSAKKKRSDDSYSPGGKAGLRPDRALTVYCRNVRRLFGEVFIGIGGLEASLRRFAHYDYWADKVMPSVLISSGADVLMYGMGERQIAEIAQKLYNGSGLESLYDVKGICYAVAAKDYKFRQATECPSYEIVKEPTESGKKQYAIACRLQHREADSIRGKTVIQRHGDKILIQNPPSPPLETDELDRVYELPYMRDYHPAYKPLGGVPAIEEVKFSITHVRGCFGACNFCSIAYHQGRAVTNRSKESVLREAELLTKMPDFKGYIHDVGGPSANFSRPSCEVQKNHGLCADKKCLAPKPCANLVADHTAYLDLLRSVRKLPKVKKVFIRSGIRFDYVMQDKNDEFFKELVQYHVSGQLKVAPEHCSDNVLRYMGKPSFDVYTRFKEKFYRLTKSVGLKQYLVPYLMSSHPGSTINDAIELACFLKKEGLHPQQVQDFYPTPGTISTAMYYTGLNPYDLKPVFVAKTAKEKSEQRILLQYFKPENRQAVYDILIKNNRKDLIGTSPECLVNYPESGAFRQKTERKNSASSKAFAVGKKSGKKVNKDKNKR